MEPVAVDVARRDHAHRHLLRAAEHRVKELLALLLAALLRVVQIRQRTHAMLLEACVVQQHTRDDERSGERAATCFVGSRNEARTKLPVESEELLAGRLHDRRH